LKENIIAQSAASPLTFRDYLHTPHGALYGIQKNVHEPAKTTVAARTKIPNLLFTGQNVNMHGVLGVSITAIATCAELLGLDYLLQKINGTG
jgi:all-trans-retinol 13,14-reductase